MAYLALLVLGQHKLHHLPEPVHSPSPVLELSYHRRQGHDIVRPHQLGIIPQNARLDLEDLALEGGQMYRVDGCGDGAADGRRVGVGYLGRVADELDVDVAKMCGRGEELTLGRGYSGEGIWL